MVEQIVQNKYLPGGVSGALGTAFVDGIGDVFGKSASAQIHAIDRYEISRLLAQFTPRLGGLASIHASIRRVQPSE